MVRLYVLYNLPSGSDEEAYIRWRLTDHQRDNLALPGMVHTDFARAFAAWPEGAEPRFRFVTTIDWPDRESFLQGFYDAGVQANLRESLKRTEDAVFLVGEVLTDQWKEGTD